MSGSRVVAFGHHQPERVLTNAELDKMVDTNDEWIRPAYGHRHPPHRGRRVRHRHGRAAAAKALASSGPDAGRHRPGHRRDLLRDRPLPERSPPRSPPGWASLARPCFDLNNACAGFCTRSGHRRPRRPRGCRAARAGHRRREDVRPHRLDRPRHAASCSATAPGAVVISASRATRQDRRRHLGFRPDAQQRRPPRRRLAAAVRAGGSGRLPLGHHATARHRPAGLRTGRARSRPTSPPS